MAQDPGTISKTELSKEIGISGWTTYPGWGILPIDSNPDWSPYSARGLGLPTSTITDAIRQDPVCRGLVTILTETIRRGDLKVALPKQPSDEERDRVDWITYNYEECLPGGAQSWLEGASLAQIYGFWLHEIIIEARQTPWGMRQVLVGLEDRPPWTVKAWIEDEHGNLIAVRQTDSQGRQATIPASKLIVYTHNYAEGGREGLSDLRSMHFARQAKQRVLRQDMANREMYGIHTPVASQTEQTVAVDATNNMSTALEAYRSGQLTSLVAPFGFDVDLTSTSTPIPDPTAIVDLYNREMVMGAQALWTLHGTSEQGTRGTTTLQHQAFQGTLLSRADSLCRAHDTPGRDGTAVVRLLCDLAYKPSPDVRYPTLYLSGIEQRDLVELTGMLRNLVEGRVIEPDPALETWTRDKAGIPEREDTASKYEEDRP